MTTPIGLDAAGQLRPAVQSGAPEVLRSGHPRGRRSLRRLVAPVVFREPTAATLIGILPLRSSHLWKVKEPRSHIGAFS
jgi:hypothetical protein